MKWFRFYDEVLDDPKCQRLTPTMFRHWVNLLCIASRSATRGVLPDLEDIAFGLRLSEAKTMSVLNHLYRAGLLDFNDGGTWTPHGWDKRQRVSDDVAQRVTKHREKNADEPLQKQKSNVTKTLPHVRATEADTEADTDTEADGVNPPNPRKSSKPAKPPDYTVEFESFWQAYPSGHGDKKPSFEVWEKLSPDTEMAQAILDGVHGWQLGQKWREGFIRDAQRWLRDRSWENIPPPMSSNLTHIRSPNGRDIGLTDAELDARIRGETA